MLERELDPPHSCKVVPVPKSPLNVAALWRRARQTLRLDSCCCWMLRAATNLLRPPAYSVQLRDPAARSMASRGRGSGTGTGMVSSKSSVGASGSESTQNEAVANARYPLWAHASGAGLPPPASSASSGSRGCN